MALIKKQRTKNSNGADLSFEEKLRQACLPAGRFARLRALRGR
ncbi:MAG: hypothetical protein AABY46_01760 [Nitrospirota bacterium]